MQISRMDLADKGSPEGIVMAILKAEPNLPIPVPIEELCRQLDIIEIQALTTQGFEGGLLTDRERSRGIILVRNGVSRQRRKMRISELVIFTQAAQQCVDHRVARIYDSLRGHALGKQRAARVMRRRKVQSAHDRGYASIHLLRERLL